MEKNRSKYLVLVMVATIALAVLGIVLAYKIYELRNESVAPTAPEEASAAEEPSEACTLTFTVAEPSVSPTPTGTVTPTLTLTPTPTNTPVPTSTPTGVPTSTPTNTPTPKPTSTVVPTATSTLAPGEPSPTAKPTVPQELPQAGITFPGGGAVVGGLIFVLSAFLILL